MPSYPVPRGAIKDEVAALKTLMKILSALSILGISRRFPQQDVHVYADKDV
jgi:hypothetical protein